MQREVNEEKEKKLCSPDCLATLAWAMLGRQWVRNIHTKPALKILLSSSRAICASNAETQWTGRCGAQSTKPGRMSSSSMPRTSRPESVHINDFMREDSRGARFPKKSVKGEEGKDLEKCHTTYSYLVTTGSGRNLVFGLTFK